MLQAYSNLATAVTATTPGALLQQLQMHAAAQHDERLTAALTLLLSNAGVPEGAVDAITHTQR